MMMKPTLLCALALPLTASVAVAQTSRDITKTRPEIARPQIAFLCRTVPVGTVEAFTAISGQVDGDSLKITVKGKCFGQRQRNLSFSISPEAQLVGQPPLVRIASLAVSSWSSTSASFLTAVQDTAPIRAQYNYPVFMLALSAGNRTYVTRLSEDEFNVVQSGGTITNPAIWLNRP
jgi:hypothetical protein